MSSKDLKRVLEKFSGENVATMVPTDSVSLDRLFGGGLPLGRYIQIYSPQGLGKTTVAVWVAVALASRGHKTLFLDVENGLDASLVEGCGGQGFLDNGFIQVVRPYTFAGMEEVFDAVVPSGEFSLIVVDSITAVMPSKLIEESVEDAQIGLTSRMVSNFLTKYKAPCRLNSVTVLWLNQVRTKIDLRFGGSVASAGGWALKHYSDVIIALKKGKFIVEDKQIIGSTVSAVAEKNKLHPPYREYPLHIVFGRGISDLRTFLSIMDEHNLIEQKGAYYLPVFAPEGTKSLLGNEALFNWVRDNRELVEEELRKRGLA